MACSGGSWNSPFRAIPGHLCNGNIGGAGYPPFGVHPAPVNTGVRIWGRVGGFEGGRFGGGQGYQYGMIWRGGCWALIRGGSLTRAHFRPTYRGLAIGRLEGAHGLPLLPMGGGYRPPSVT